MIKSIIRISIGILILMATSPVLAEFDYTEYDMDVASFFVEVHDWVHQKEMTKKEFLNIYEPVKKNADLKSLQAAVRSIYSKKSTKGVSNRTFVVSLHRLILRENPRGRNAERQLMKDSIGLLATGAMSRQQIVEKYMKTEKAQVRMSELLVELKSAKEEARFAAYKLDQ